MQTLKNLQNRLHATVLLVGHDMGLMAQFAERVGIMYGGELVEVGEVDKIFVEPKHPYTRLLIDSISSFETKGDFRGIPGNAMALDLGPYGIRVCALMPGSIDTEGMDEAARLLRGENIPLGRPGEPDDMAGPALFLASDDARYITGDVIKVDGGMLSQQRSATVDIMPPSDFPTLEQVLEDD